MNKREKREKLDKRDGFNLFPSYLPSRLKRILQAIGHIAIITAVMCVAVAGFFYAILGEVDLRELRASDGWYTWQHEKALAQRYADRDLTHPASPITRHGRHASQSLSR